MRLVVVVVALLCTSTSLSAGVVLDGRITKLMIDKTHGDKTFITTDGVQTGTLQCHTNGSWQFVMSLSQEIERTVFLAMLLSAHASGKPVKLEGTGLCDVNSTIESLRRIETLE